MRTRFLLITGYLGAVIGAGFASGQEIVQFFVIYGERGFAGVILATILFALCGGLLLFWAHEHKISSYQNIIAMLLGEKAGVIVDILLAVFLFIGISTMMAASGAVFFEHLYLSKNLGILIAYVLIIAFLFSGRQGLISAYYYLVPLKIILLLIIATLMYILTPGSVQVSYPAYLEIKDYKWAISGLLYVAYNFALAMVVLTEYQSIGNKRDAVIGAAWGGLILGGLVMLCYSAMLKFMPMVMHYQVPMLFMAGNVSIGTKYIYTGVLWIGIMTTAMANAYGVAQRFYNYSKLKFGTCLLLVTTLALPLAFQSFSVLVGRVYPVFGLLGLIILGALLFKAGQDMGLRLYYNITKSIFRRGR